MKLNIKLPQEYEQKWQRIAAFLGKDIDLLIVQGIDYVWEHNKKDIVDVERTTARCKRKLAKTEERLKLCGS